MTGASPSSLRDPRAVERRRHHEDPQILAQARLRVARQRQPEIGIERALVKFVEQHRGDAGQFRIVEDQAGENALGDDLDAGRARHLRAEPHAVADGLADPLAKRLRHPLGAGARRDPPRLQHDDLLAARPGRIEQRQRHPRGLAGAGRRHQHRGVVAASVRPDRPARRRSAAACRKCGANHCSVIARNERAKTGYRSIAPLVPALAGRGSGPCAGHVYL